tara:strand:+ start:951 stop:1664 length:714 start_codon:yes stop_codon:yes gene_type:complete
MTNRAIILCGGKGKRLRPYTNIFPKPLMPIGEFPILEIVIKKLRKHNFKHITLAVNHQAKMIESFFGNGSKWNIKIDYSLESKELGTMGPLKLINDLPENFLVMNADILTDLNFNNFLNYHKKNKNNFTVSSHTRVENIDYGVLICNKKSELIQFEEKPNEKFNVSMGVYAINRGILKLIPKNKKFGFDSLMLEMLKKNIKVKVKKHNNYWLDIGRPSDYQRATEVFLENKKLFIDD